MKKILATVLTIVFVFSISCPVYAAVTPADLEGKTNDVVRISKVYSREDLSFHYLEELLKEAAINGNGSNPLWVITSLNNQQNYQFYYFPNRSLEEVKTYYYDNFLNDIDESVDFIQTGVVMDSFHRESIEDGLENAPFETAINLLNAVEKDVAFSISESLPVYWNIQDINFESFILEIAIGKYEIKPGDCLSVLAEQFDTTVKLLMSNNQNIFDPDLIYAGDFLVIKE